jgi:hypothetical protein
VRPSPTREGSDPSSGRKSPAPWKTKPAPIHIRARRWKLPQTHNLHQGLPVGQFSSSPGRTSPATGASCKTDRRDISFDHCTSMRVSEVGAVLDESDGACAAWRTRARKGGDATICWTAPSTIGR